MQENQRRSGHFISKRGKRGQTGAVPGQDEPLPRIPGHIKKVNVSQ